MKTALYLGGPSHGRITFTFDMKEGATVRKEFAPHAPLHTFHVHTYKNLTFLVHEGWSSPDDWQTVANELIDFFKEHQP